MPIRTVAIHTSLPILATALLLTGCGNTAPTNTAAPTAERSFVPPRDRTATPLPGQTPDTPITAYVGKYPHDPVAGVLFFDRTDVANALVDAVGDPAIRGHMREVKGPEKAIFTRAGKIGAAGCDTQDCGGRNWTFLFDPADASGEACYHDTATMQDSSRWFANNTATMRAGACPSA